MNNVFSEVFHSVVPEDWTTWRKLPLKYWTADKSISDLAIVQVIQGVEDGTCSAEYFRILLFAMDFLYTNPKGAAPHVFVKYEGDEVVRAVVLLSSKLTR